MRKLVLFILVLLPTICLCQNYYAAIRANNGNYLSFEQGGEQLVANQNAINTSSFFLVTPVNNSHTMVQMLFKGKTPVYYNLIESYIKADGKNREQFLLFFTILPIGDKTMFMTPDGRYLTQGSHGEIYLAPLIKVTEDNDSRVQFFDFTNVILDLAIIDWRFDQKVVNNINYIYFYPVLGNTGSVTINSPDQIILNAYWVEHGFYEVNGIKVFGPAQSGYQKSDKIIFPNSTWPQGGLVPGGNMVVEDFYIRLPWEEYGSYEPGSFNVDYEMDQIDVNNNLSPPSAMGHEYKNAWLSNDIWN